MPPLAAGASCTVTETANGAVPGVVDVTTAPPLPVTVTIAPGETATVTVTNTYSSVPGSLTVVKQTAGADEFRGSITVTATCTPPGGGPVTASQTYPPRAPFPPLVIGGLAAGTVCTITEPVDGSTPALDVTTTPSLPLVVTIDAGEHETATITNTYTPVNGTLIVAKDIDGPAAGQQGPIEITAVAPTAPPPPSRFRPEPARQDRSPSPS